MATLISRHERLLDLVEDSDSQPRLSELREKWGDTDGFEQAVIEAIKHGRIRVYPLGEVVKVKSESEPGIPQ